jgi:hypothetical protein
VHAEDGSRVGYDLLQKVPSEVLCSAILDPLDDSGVTGHVTLLQVPDAQSDRICFFGNAVGLEPDLLSFQEQGSEDCIAFNGCGAHVHKGTPCENTSTHMGQYAKWDSLPADRGFSWDTCRPIRPWKVILLTAL